MRRKIAEIYLTTATVLVVLMSLLLIYWSFIDGVFVHKITNKNFIVYKTDKEVYYPGDSVYVSTKYLCKNRDIKAQTYLNLTDTVSIPYEVKNRAIMKGCVDENKFYLFATIPLFLPDGKYYFNGFHQYDINPIRQGDEGIQVYFMSNTFEINSHKIQAID